MWWRTPWLRQRLLMLGLALLDTLLLFGFYNALSWIRFKQLAGSTWSLGFVVLLWISTSYLLGRYSKPEWGQKDSKRKRLVATGVVALFVLMSVVVVLAWGFAVEDPRTFRGFVIPVLVGVSLTSGLAQIWASGQQGRRQHWLLVGNRQELEVLRQELAREAPARHLQLQFRDCGVLGGAAVAPDDSIDGIAVSETASLGDALLEELLALRAKGIGICSLVVWSELHLQRVPPELFSSRWLVQAEGFELQPGRWGWRVKRLADVIVASLLLFLLMPLFPIIALLIRMEDGGKIFYGQERTGLYGEKIRIWKFRTMTEENNDGKARWAQREDVRITRIGHWLRKLRLDELPQLGNVLKGEMSLIGPRPEQPDLELALEEQIPHYRVRHWIRPGLSGWAQVCYRYGASVEDSRMKLCYDIYYLRNVNLLLDILITLKTVKMLMHAEGASPKA
jgi:exopolysaccharide biosynthesis polyprenyl glycosylphosphotransferase